MLKSEASTEWQNLFINKVQCLVPYFTLENPLLLINKKFNKEGIKLLTKELVEVEQCDWKQEVGDRDGMLYDCMSSYYSEYDREGTRNPDADFDHITNFVIFKNKHFNIECVAAIGICVDEAALSNYVAYDVDYHATMHGDLNFYYSLNVKITNTLTQHAYNFDFDDDRNCFSDIVNGLMVCYNDDLDDYIKVFACDRFIIVQTENTQIVWDHESKRFNQYNDGQMKLRLSNMTLRDVFSYNDMGYKASILISHDDYVVCFSKQD